MDLPTSLQEGKEAADTHLSPVRPCWTPDLQSCTKVSLCGLMPLCFFRVATEILSTMSA